MAAARHASQARGGDAAGARRVAVAGPEGSAAGSHRVEEAGAAVAHERAGDVACPRCHDALHACAAGAFTPSKEAIGHPSAAHHAPPPEPQRLAVGSFDVGVPRATVRLGRAARRKSGSIDRFLCSRWRCLPGAIAHTAPYNAEHGVRELRIGTKTEWPTSNSPHSGRPDHSSLTSRERRAIRPPHCSGVAAASTAYPMRSL